MKRLDQYLIEDRYFKSSIGTIYYDNDNYQMINRSMESPFYNEKAQNKGL